MAQFATLPNGTIDDRVRIILNNDDVHILESYEVRLSYMQAPASFACRLGNGEVTRAITAKYPPNTTCEVKVGTVTQFTGNTDGYSPEGSKGATEVNLRGRDTLAPLHDDMITADRSFKNASYVELISLVLQAVGIDEFTLFGDNAANRNSRAGQTGGGTRLIDNPTQETKDALARLQKEQQQAIAANSSAAFVPTTPGQKPVLTRLGVTVVSAPTAPIVEIIKATPPSPQAKPLQAKVGGRWWDFIKKELDRAGLFLFAAGERGVFIVGQPKTKQAAKYQLIRQRNAVANTVNVLSARHTNDTTRRASHYVVHGRGGKGFRKTINAKIGASFIDEEMVALGFTRHKVVSDPQANNDKRAEYLCKRLAAEDRRQSWTLSYTVKGHTTPSLTGEDRLVWAVDTIVSVRDDELGIYGDHWIESVTFRGDANSGTTTELTLLRPTDLVFGDPDLNS